MTRRRPLTGTAVQNGILDAARKLGYLCLHVPDMRRTEPGWPDIVIVSPADMGAGIMLALECKSRGEHLRPATVSPRSGRLLPSQLDWLEAFGAITSVVSGVVRDEPGDQEYGYEAILDFLRDRRER